MSLIIARQLLSKVNCSLYGTPAAVAPPPDYTLPAYDAARADLLALGRRLRATAQEFNVHTGSMPFEPSPPGLPSPDLSRRLKQPREQLQQSILVAIHQRLQTQHSHMTAYFDAFPCGFRVTLDKLCPSAKGPPPDHLFALLPPADRFVIYTHSKVSWHAVLVLRKILLRAADRGLPRGKEIFDIWADPPTPSTHTIALLIAKSPQASRPARL